MTSTNTEARHQPVTIIVNTQPHAWAEHKISFEQVLELAFPGQAYDPAGTTVEYSKGEGPDKPLRKGHSVPVKEGMVFDSRCL